MVDKSDKTLTDYQKQKLYLLLEHSDVFATKESDLGKTTKLTLQSIHTGDIKHPSNNILGEFHTIRDTLT